MEKKENKGSKEDRLFSYTEIEKKLLEENRILQQKLQEAEDSLNSIRNGEVDAIVVGERIFSLSGAETPYRHIIEQMEEGAVTLSSNGDILYCNPRFARVIGLSGEKITGTNLAFFVDEEDIPAFNKLLSRGKHGRSTAQLRLITVSGSEHCIFTVSPLPQSVSGDICIIISNITDLKKFQEQLTEIISERTSELEKANTDLQEDIRQRRDTEEKLAKNEHILNYFLDNAPIGVIRWIEAGPIMYANDHFLKMIGYTREDLNEGKIDWTKMTPPEFSERDIEAFEEFYSTGKCYPYEKAYYRKDGSVLPILISSVQIEDNREGIGFVLDLTEIKNKENQMHEAERLLLDAQRMAKSGSWEFNFENEKIRWSENTYRIYDKNPENFTPSLEGLYASVHPDDRQMVEKSINKAITSLTDYNVRYRIIVNNEIRHINTIAHIITDESGKPFKINGTSQDVTESVQREKQLQDSERKAVQLFEDLRESERKYRELVKVAPVAIYEVDFTKKKLVSVNDSMVILSGYSREELLNMNPLDILDDESKVRFRSRLKTASEGKKPKEIVEYKVISKDGRIIDALLNVSYQYNEEGLISGALVIGHDMTESKRAAEELLKAKQNADDQRKRLEALIKISPLGIIIIEKASRKFVFANESAEKCYNMSLTDVSFPVEGLKWFTTENEMLGVNMWPVYRSLFHGETLTKNEYILERHDGSRIFISISSAPLLNGKGETEAVIGIIEDITHDTMIQKHLQYQSYLLENIQDAIIAADKDMRITFWNKGAEKIYGWKTEEVIGKTGPEILDSRFVDTTREEAIRLAMEKGSMENHVLHKHKDGHYVEIQSVFTTLKDKKGNSTDFISVNRDITEARERQRENELLANIIAESSQAIAFSSLEGKLLFTNKAFEKLTGYSKAELIGMEWNSRLTAPEYREKELLYKEELLMTGNPQQYQKEYLRKDHTRVPVEILLNTKKDEKGEPEFFFAFATDITERKRYEANLHKMIRTLRAMQRSSQLMNHAKDEKKFMQDVCRIIIEDCNYKMVWIGLKQDDEKKSIKPIASAGFDEEYLKTLNLTWNDTERGRGPTGIAARTGKIAMCRNMGTDPAFEPWREEALKRGYSSSIAFPLTLDDKPFGVLTIYSYEPDPFTDDEQHLLMRLADDLSYGIMSIRLNAELKRSKQELEYKVIERTSLLQRTLRDLDMERKRFQDVLNMIPAYVILMTPDLKISFANRIFIDTFGNMEERKCTSHPGFKGQGCEICNLDQVIINNTQRHWEWEAPNGRIYSVSDFPFTDSNTSLILEMGVDITEKKNFQQYVLSKILETEEKDRRRFASDLHDDLGPTLSAIKMQLGLLATESRQEDREEVLNVCDLLLSEGIEKMRTLANNIMPSLIESYGLEIAVKSFIHRMQGTGQIKYNFISNLEGFRFDSETELHLYRVVTELINNTIKHSGATKVDLSLMKDDKNLEIIYSDNGIGYDLSFEGQLMSSGIGLQNIQNRIKLIEATIDFINRFDKTVVIIRKQLN